MTGKPSGFQVTVTFIHRGLSLLLLGKTAETKLTKYLDLNEDG